VKTDVSALDPEEEGPAEEKEPEMGKILAGVAVGFFVGVVVIEVVKKTNPTWLRKAKAKMRNGARAAKDAFMEGYEVETA
jgi:hypothetical protein